MSVPSPVAERDASVYHSKLQYIIVYQSISEYITVYHSLSHYIIVHCSISIYHSILQYIKVYQSTSRYHNISQYIKYINVPQYITVHSPLMQCITAYHEMQCISDQLHMKLGQLHSTAAHFQTSSSKLSKIAFKGKGGVVLVFSLYQPPTSTCIGCPK